MFAFFKKLFGKADVNKDGAVDRKDAEVVVEAVKAGAAKAKQEVKKASTAGAKKRNFPKKPRQAKPTA